LLKAPLSLGNLGTVKVGEVALQKWEVRGSQYMMSFAISNLFLLSVHLQFY
jgi:hypothetical protein